MEKKKKKLIKYIASTFTYDNAAIGNCRNETIDENGGIYSTSCNSDSQYLFGKIF